MGNRAVISFSTDPAAPSIYLHWNGGRASVEGFLAGCLATGYRATGNAQADMDQIERRLRPFFARNRQMLSLYTQPVSRADKSNGDNGWYILAAADLRIIGRRCFIGCEEEDNEKAAAIATEIIRLATAPRCRYEHLWPEVWA
jgi:hypothetical protein